MHNPEKSRALCVVAKASYQILLTAGYLFLVLFVTIILIGITHKAYTDWPKWSEFVDGLRVVAALAVFVLVVGGPLFAAIKLFEWAKKYRSDC